MKIILLSLAFLITGMSAENVVLGDYTGTWEYKVETPEGPYKGAIVLEKGDRGYKGHLDTDVGKIDIKDLKIEGDKISFSVSVQGFNVGIKGTFEGETLSCTASVEGMQLPLIAKRVEE
jgi:hypothetical protein